jgi:hypothetical protein
LFSWSNKSWKKVKEKSRSSVNQEKEPPLESFFPRRRNQQWNIQILNNPGKFSMSPFAWCRFLNYKLEPDETILSYAEKKILQN